MSMIKKVGLTGVVLAIVFVVAFICFNRKEKKIDRKQDLPVSTETISEYSFTYTRALLHAIPKCESGCRERLEPIPGMAPSLANPPAGCPFVTRCRFACEECKKGIPSMRAYSDTQSSRCIFTKEELDEKEKKEEEK